MAQYLSDEWMDQAAAGLAGDPALQSASADADLTIVYEVSAAPGGKRVYALRFDHGTVTLEPGPHPDAPVNFSMDYNVAAQIAQGELSAQAAFMQGSLKLGGDMTVLIRQHGLLGALTDALGDLRSTTTY